MPARRKPAAPRPPRLPRFSPTRLDLYRFCPRAYAFQYDEGLRWGGQSPGMSFGGSMHRALQDFHRSGGAGAMSVEQLKARLGERWSAAGYGSDEEAAQFLATGERLLEQHHEASREPGRLTLGTELTLEQRYEGFVLFGKIDRLDRRPDGSLEVIDYKSMRRGVTEDDVRASLAMTVYQLLVARHNPGVAVHTGILSLQTGQSAFVLRSPEELDRAEREICALAGAIMADREKPALPGEQCRRCVYPRVCPPGRAYLRERPEPG